MFPILCIIVLIKFDRFVDRDMIMRYYKGLGIGHIYTRLEPDDALLINHGGDGTQDTPILIDDNLDPALPETNITIVSGSGEEDDLDVNSDTISNHNGEDSSDDGSDDCLDLEHDRDETYVDRCDSDYED